MGGGYPQSAPRASWGAVWGGEGADRPVHSCVGRRGRGSPQTAQTWPGVGLGSVWGGTRLFTHVPFRGRRKGDPPSADRPYLVWGRSGGGLRASTVGGPPLRRPPIPSLGAVWGRSACPHSRGTPPPQTPHTRSGVGLRSSFSSRILFYSCFGLHCGLRTTPPQTAQTGARWQSSLMGRRGRILTRSFRE